MKNKSNQKIAEAKAAHLAAVTASREADAATQRADLAKVMLKKARKSYKQARKAAKRAAKSAKQAQQEFADLAKYLKRSKSKAAAKPKAKRPAIEIQPAPKKNAVSGKRPAARFAPTLLPGDSITATSQVT